MELNSKRATVLGYGRTGRAVARFLAQQGTSVFVSERSALPPDVRRELEALGVEHEGDGHTPRALTADVIIPSPGVPERAPLLAEAQRRGIPVVGELELAYRLCPADVRRRLIAVTGTVGKTTTTQLIAELLRAHGHCVVVAGNIGRPFIDALCEITPQTVVVLEVSSYQLEHVEAFKPHIGVFTRFAPHHLDRHGSPERYFELKCRLFAHQSERDFAVVHREVAVRLPGWVRARVLPFSADDPDVRGLELPPHQRENVAAALKVARLIDPHISLQSVDLRRALQLPHRLEPVAEIDGVRFYNDSKATSPEATRAALRALAGEPLVLIAGGYDEGVDPQLLARAVQDHAEDVRAVVLLGQTQKKWAQALRRIGFARVQTARSLRQALSEALKLRPRVCLFSPAAPSFDRHQSYEERGERFRQAVLSLRP